VIELGILRLQPDWCDIKLVLEAAVACLPPEGAVMVDVSCATDLPVVWADHDRLEQVFVNLLGNAVGHNPPGTPVRVRAEPGAPGSVTITVTDDGVGLPPEVASAPFEPGRARNRGQDGGSRAQVVHRAQHRRRPRRLLEIGPSLPGASFAVRLPVEDGTVPVAADRGHAVPRQPGDRGRQRARKGAVARGRAGR
jgi:signal transduction histidine kinase